MTNVQHRRARPASRRLLSIVAAGALATVGCTTPNSAPGSVPSGRPEPVPSPAPTPQTTPEEDPMRIRLMTSDAELIATLADNAASRDFVALLPLTLTLRDFNGTEKISDLPAELSTAGAPDGLDPDIGDLTYYAPWGNLAIFYRDFDYSRGLVKLGRISSGADQLGSLTGQVTIEVAP